MNLTSVQGGTAVKKPGRPRVHEDERRRHRITIAVSASEKAEIERRAALCHHTPSEYLRACGLGRRPRVGVPQLNIEAYRELGAMVERLLDDEDLDSRERERLLEEIQAARRRLLNVNETDEES